MQLVQQVTEKTSDYIKTKTNTNQNNKSSLKTSLQTIKDKRTSQCNTQSSSGVYKELQRKANFIKNTYANQTIKSIHQKRSNQESDKVKLGHANTVNCSNFYANLYPSKISSSSPIIDNSKEIQFEKNQTNFPLKQQKSYQQQQPQPQKQTRNTKPKNMNQKQNNCYSSSSSETPEKHNVVDANADDAEKETNQVIMNNGNCSIDQNEPNVESKELFFDIEQVSDEDDIVNQNNDDKEIVKEPTIDHRTRKSPTPSIDPLVKGFQVALDILSTSKTDDDSKKLTDENDPVVKRALERLDQKMQNAMRKSLNDRQVMNEIFERRPERKETLQLRRDTATPTMLRRLSSISNADFRRSVTSVSSEPKHFTATLIQPINQISEDEPLDLRCPSRINQATRQVKFVVDRAIDIPIRYEEERFTDRPLYTSKDKTLKVFSEKLNQTANDFQNACVDPIARKALERFDNCTQASSARSSIFSSSSMPGKPINHTMSFDRAQRLPIISNDHSYSRIHTESPSIDRSHLVESPSIGRSHLVESPSIGRSHLVESPSIGRSHLVESPSIGRSHLIESPSINRSHLVESPSINRSHLLESPSINRSHLVESPSINRPKQTETHFVNRIMESRSKPQVAESHYFRKTPADFHLFNDNNKPQATSYHRPNLSSFHYTSPDGLYNSSQIFTEPLDSAFTKIDAGYTKPSPFYNKYSSPEETSFISHPQPNVSSMDSQSYKTTIEDQCLADFNRRSSQTLRPICDYIERQGFKINRTHNTAKHTPRWQYMSSSREYTRPRDRSTFVDTSTNSQRPPPSPSNNSRYLRSCSSYSNLFAPPASLTNNNRTNVQNERNVLSGRSTPMNEMMDNSSNFIVDSRSKSLERPMNGGNGEKSTRGNKKLTVLSRSKTDSYNNNRSINGSLKLNQKRSKTRIPCNPTDTLNASQCDPTTMTVFERLYRNGIKK